MIPPCPSNASLPSFPQDAGIWTGSSSRMYRPDCGPVNGLHGVWCLSATGWLFSIAFTYSGFALMVVGEFAPGWGMVDAGNKQERGIYMQCTHGVLAGSEAGQHHLAPLARYPSAIRPVHVHVRLTHAGPRPSTGAHCSFNRCNVAAAHTARCGLRLFLRRNDTGRCMHAMACVRGRPACCPATSQSAECPVLPSAIFWSANLGAKLRKSWASIRASY